MIRVIWIVIGASWLTWAGWALPARAESATTAPQGQADDDYELQKLLVDALDQIERNYVKPISRRELVEAAIKGALSKLDPYSSFIDPKAMEEFRTSVESEFAGIGIQVTKDGDELKVISPLAGTPAYRAGILAGDRIVQIDSTPTEGLSLDEAVKMLKGPEGTEVTLTVVHPGRAAPVQVRVRRERIHIETVLGDHRHPDDTWDFMLDHEHRIGYIRLIGFSRDTAKDLRAALEELQKSGLRGLILDMRFNPGGLLTSAVEVSDLFVADGRIVSTQGRNTAERTWDAHKEGTFDGFPMAVLVNRFSASASEIVAACLQDHGRAKVVGERTWGKGSVQNVIELDDRRSALKLTTSAYQRPSGKNIHRFPGAGEDADWGVKPDAGFEVRLSDREMVALLEDRRARDILRPKPAEPSQPGEATAPAGQAGASSEPASTAVSSETPESKPAEPRFVDRQLKLALDYLRKELGKAPDAS